MAPQHLLSLKVCWVWLGFESTPSFLSKQKKVRPKNRLCHSPGFSRNETTKNSDPKHGSGRVFTGIFTKEGRIHLLPVMFNSWAPMSKKQRALKNEWQRKTNQIAFPFREVSSYFQGADVLKLSWSTTVYKTQKERLVSFTLPRN